MTAHNNDAAGRPEQDPTTPLYLQDMTSGQVHVVAVRPRARVHTQPFAMIFQDALLELLANRALVPVDLRVLLYLIAVCTYENIAEAFITEIAEALDHERGTVSASLKRLTQQNLIRTVTDRHGRPRVMQLHPGLVYRGKVGQREAELRANWADKPWRRS